jgi:uncharacterized membrane protein/mono/diheme cytochrome c family protein
LPFICYIDFIQIETMLLKKLFYLDHGGSWLWNLLGRLHPLAVHFPVALMLFAVFLELLTFKKFNSPLRPAIKICILTGALSSIISAVFGLLLASDGDYAPETLTIHQWSGIITTVLALAALFFLYIARGKSTIILYRTMLFITATGIAVTGHFGASLTHGDDYLSAAFHNNKTDSSASPAVDFAAFKTDTAHLNSKQEMDLNIQVKAIFAHNCYKCHGAEKIKGDLRLDNKKMIFRGGESGPLFIAGHPSESEIIRRLSLPRNDTDAMPPKGKKIAEDDIKTIGFWIQKGAPWPDQSANEKTFRIAKLEPRNPLLPADIQHLVNPIDIWVNEYFKKNKDHWQKVVGDRTYLRRIYLDITGLLPTPADLDAFEKDTRQDKRLAWVRQLLNRDDDYAIHWLTFWNDALRNDYTGTGYITGGRYDITGWLYASLKNNKPYNQFVKELISPDKKSKGFIEGIKWRGVVNASQRTEIQAAQNVSQVFLGLNLKCASCHNSFINEWKLEDAYAFANIFSDTSLEINRCDKPTGKYTNARMLWPQLGAIDSSASHIEKQKQLAALMVQPANGRIYRTIVNRVWAQLMGRGIVEPVDMMDNEPWSQDLLDWLASNFTQQGNYDIKELIYQITTSRIYQLPSSGLANPARLTAQDFRFTGMVRRRMSAEQFSDAVGNIVWPVFADSMVRYKPFFKLKEAEKSPLVNRASLVQNNSFLTALGRPNRENVSTGRESQANLLQALELTNGKRFIEALKKGAEKWNEKYARNEDLVNQVYLKSLGRLPRQEEMNPAIKLFNQSSRKEAVEDVLWAVMLLPEFQLIY